VDGTQQAVRHRSYGVQFAQSTGNDDAWLRAA
jgi:hypothetical protein